jgi:hypothetical protein
MLVWETECSACYIFSNGFLCWEALIILIMWALKKFICSDPFTRTTLPEHLFRRTSCQGQHSKFNKFHHKATSWSKAGYRRASFLWQVFMWQILFAKCTCENATNFIWQVFIWQVLFTKGVNVSTSLLWQFISIAITSNAQITLTLKFSLLTHTDEQNLHFDFASMLAFEQVHLS